MNGIFGRVFIGALFVVTSSSSWANPLLRSVVLTNQLVPGAPDLRYTSSPTPPTINNLGQIAFLAGFIGANDYVTTSGIWTNSNYPNGQVIVSAQQPVPGAVAGSRFGDFGAPKLNDLGQVAFAGSI